MPPPEEDQVPEGAPAQGSVHRRRPGRWSDRRNTERTTGPDQRRRGIPPSPLSHLGVFARPPYPVDRLPGDRDHPRRRRSFRRPHRSGRRPPEAEQHRSDDQRGDRLQQRHRQGSEVFVGPPHQGGGAELPYRAARRHSRPRRRPSQRAVQEMEGRARHVAHQGRREDEVAPVGVRPGLGLRLPRRRRDQGQRPGSDRRAGERAGRSPLAHRRQPYHQRATRSCSR